MPPSSPTRPSAKLKSNGAGGAYPSDLPPNTSRRLGNSKLYCCCYRRCDRNGQRLRPGPRRCERHLRLRSRFCRQLAVGAPAPAHRHSHPFVSRCLQLLGGQHMLRAMEQGRYQLQLRRSGRTSLWCALHAGSGASGTVGIFSSGCVWSRVFFT